MRLGTADRAAPDGSGLLPAVPVTAGLREVGALGLAGPRARLAGLARAVLAQLAALHSPDIAGDRPDQPRTAPARWRSAPPSGPGWAGCRMSVRGTARTAGCSSPTTANRPRPAPTSSSAAWRTSWRMRARAPARQRSRRRADEYAGDRAPHAHRSTAPSPDRFVPAPRRPSWARDADSGADAAAGFPGPYTVRRRGRRPRRRRPARGRRAAGLEGPRAGIHVVCLAETAAASPASPVTETYEAACAVAPAFRECGAVALLSGDVATALRLMRVARAGDRLPRRAGRARHRRHRRRRIPRLGRAVRAGAGAPADGRRRRASGSRASPHRCRRRPGCWTSWAWPGPPRRR